MTSISKHVQLVASMKDAEQKPQNEENFFLVELVTAATLDEVPEYTLKDINEALLEAMPWGLLDPMDLLPLLISSESDGASDLIQTISQKGNAKETILAALEALERLEKNLASETEEGTESGQKYTSELVRLLGACENSICRVKLRIKGPTETLRPVLTHIGAVVELIAPKAGRDGGRHLISSTSCLIKATLPWLSQNTTANGPELEAGTTLLTDLLDVTLSACAVHIDASLAQRRFEALHPRLVLRSAVKSDWEGGEAAIQAALAVARSLGITSEFLFSRSPSLSQLILLAHEGSNFHRSSPTFLQKLLPILTSSLQQNIAMDESLALLLTSLSVPFKRDLPEELVNPVAGLLTPLASTHPHPPTRQVAFRTLAFLLSHASPLIHLAHLSSLLADCPFPQMRVAAVGLVKEAFLNAVTSNDKSPFASPALVLALGPIVLRPDPPDLFSLPTHDSLRKFLESSEPARLTECLSFYYVLLKRDTANSSGIHDSDMLRTVENGLLAPLRKALTSWLEDFSSSTDPHSLMPLASLETSLERVDGAIAALGSSSLR